MSLASLHGVWGALACSPGLSLVGPGRGHDAALARSGIVGRGRSAPPSGFFVLVGACSRLAGLMIDRRPDARWPAASTPAACGAGARRARICSSCRSARRSASTPSGCCSNDDARREFGRPPRDRHGAAAAGRARVTPPSTVRHDATHRARLARRGRAVAYLGGIAERHRVSGHRKAGPVRAVSRDAVTIDVHARARRRICC